MKNAVIITLVWASLTPGSFASQLPAGETPPLVLDGVILASNPADSIALVRQAGKTRARAVRIGQEYGGYALLEVARGTAVLSGPDGVVRLNLLGAEPKDARVEPVEPVEPVDEDAAKTPEDPTWIRRSFARAGAQGRLHKEMPVILTDTQVLPKLEEGEVRGIELVRLPDGTVLAEAGLLPGDVVTSINGEPLDGLDSLWSLLARFADADELRVVVERRGELVRFAYALVD